MDTLTKKTLTTKRGFTYTYYTCPAQGTKPTLFLQHGFPDSAEEWEDLITKHLRPAGYGVIAIDQLGYGGTSKPTDPAAYRFDGIAGDFVDIIDAEALVKVISFGHDWGARSAQYLYNLHPERVCGLVQLNVGYQVVSADKFDLDAVLRRTTAVYGHGLMWYWKFFTADDGARLFQENAGLAFDMLHAPQCWPDVMCTENGVRNAIEKQGEGYDLKRRPYATEEMKKTWVDRMTRDGLEGPMCWYKSTVFGHQDGVGNVDNNEVKVPYCFVGYKDDFICKKEIVFPAREQGLLPLSEIYERDGAHWGLHEYPQDLGETIVGWLTKTYE